MSHKVLNPFKAGIDEDTLTTTVVDNDSLIATSGAVYRAIDGLAAGVTKTNIQISQTSHGFDKDFVYHDGSTWVKAVATDETTCASHFAEYVDDNTFNAIAVGEVDVTSMLDVDSNPLVAGDYYYLSSSIAGKVTGTVPLTFQFQVVLKVNASNKATVIIDQPVDAVSSGAGDMLKSVYDPTNIQADVFDMDNMVESLTSKVMTSDERSKLSGIEAGAQVNVQSDWDSVAGDSLILNKPDLSVYFDKTVDDMDDIADGTLHLKFTTAEHSKLYSIAEGAEVNVQSDWSETNTSSDAFILNKPSLVTDLHSLSDVNTTGKNTNSVLGYNGTNWVPVQQGFKSTGDHLYPTESKVLIASENTDEYELATDGERTFFRVDTSSLSNAFKFSFGSEIRSGASINKVGFSYDGSRTNYDFTNYASKIEESAYRCMNFGMGVHPSFQNSWSAIALFGESVHRSYVFGLANQVSTSDSFVIGRYNDTTLDAFFAIGNGTGYETSQRSTCFHVDKEFGHTKIRSLWLWNPLTETYQSLNLDRVSDTASYVRMTPTERTKLSNIAVGAEVNVQSDWNATNGDAFILNKPSIPVTLDDLNVNDTGITDNQILKWDAATSNYVPTDLPSGGVVAWGDITGTLADQTDLQDELDDKLEASDIANLFDKTIDDLDDIADGTTYKRFSATEQTKLSGIAEGAEVNVQSDWDAVDGDALILNKPTIPSTLDDLNVNDTGIADSQILKWDSATSNYVPVDMPTDGTTVHNDLTSIQGGSVGEYYHLTSDELTKLSGIAEGAEVNVQSDWDAVDGDALILNKPSIPSTLDDLNVNDTGIADNQILKWNSATSNYIPADIPNSAVWGNITGDVSNQTDLQDILDDKLESSDIANFFDKTIDDLDDIVDGTTYKRFSATEQTKLSGIAEGAEVNVQSDWNAVDGDALILNKPSIPSTLDDVSDTLTYVRMTPTERTKLSGIAEGAEVNVQSDWDAVDGDALILNKPSIPSALSDLNVNDTGIANDQILKWDSATSNYVPTDLPSGGVVAWGDITGSVSNQTDLQLVLDDKLESSDIANFFDKTTDDLDDITDGTTYKKYSATEQSKLAGIASGAEVNVQSDWNTTDTNADAFILNKPTIPTLLSDLNVNDSGITDGQILEWDAATSNYVPVDMPSGGSSVLTTKGDILTHNGTNEVRLAAGTDGYALVADSADSNGVKWASISGGGGGVFEVVSGVVKATGSTYASDDFVFGSPQLDDDGNTAHDNRFCFDKSLGTFFGGNLHSTHTSDRSTNSMSWGSGCVTQFNNHNFAFGKNIMASNGGFCIGYNEKDWSTSSQLLTAGGQGAFAGGNIDTLYYGSIGAGQGSMAFGYMTRSNYIGGGSFIKTGTRAKGSMSFGYISNSGFISQGNDCYGSMAFGCIEGINSSTTSYITANGKASLAFGYCSGGRTHQSTGTGSFVIGTACLANVTSSGCLGYECISDGVYSLSTNKNTTAHDYAETVHGQYNIVSTGSTTTWTSTDSLFVLGNGTGTSARNNAMKVTKDGKIYFPDVYANHTTANAANVNMDSDGQILLSTSSVVFKTSVEDMLPQYAESIYSMRPVYYRSLCEHDPDEFSYWGLIAEELNEIDPRLVELGYFPDDYEYVKTGEHEKHVEIDGEHYHVVLRDGVETYIPSVTSYKKIEIDGEHYDVVLRDGVEVNVKPAEKLETDELIPMCEVKLETDVHVMEDDCTKMLKSTATKKPHGVYYDRLVVPLIKCVQMQKEEIDLQREEIDLQREEIDTLKSELAAIKQHLGLS